MLNLHKTEDHDTDALSPNTENSYVGLTRVVDSLKDKILISLDNQKIKKSLTLSIVRNVRFSDEGLNQRIAILSVGFDHHENFFLKVTKLNNGIYEVHDKDYSFASVQFTAEEVEEIIQKCSQ